MQENVNKRIAELENLIKQENEMVQTCRKEAANWCATFVESLSLFEIENAEDFAKSEISGLSEFVKKNYSCNKNSKKTNTPLLNFENGILEKVVKLSPLFAVRDSEFCSLEENKKRGNALLKLTIAIGAIGERIKKIAIANSKLKNYNAELKNLKRKI